MRKGKFFVSLLAMASIIEHILNFIRKLLYGVFDLFYFIYRLFVFAFLTIYYYVRIFMLWAAYLLFTAIQIFSFPATFIIFIFIVRSYAKSKKIGFIEACIDVSNGGAKDFVNGKKLVLISFVLSLLVYFTSYRLLFF